jgi:hypothetical protein
MLKVLAVSAFLGVAGSATPAYALWMCIKSKALTIQKTECVQRGSTVMRKCLKEVYPHDDSVFGFRGGDTGAAILCDQTDKGVILFSSASAKERVCHDTMEGIFNDF